jgi:signal transduction histidine kinase
MTDTAPPRQLETTLLAITTGFRLFAAGWLAILAAVVLAGDEKADRPVIVWATLAAVAVWVLVATAIAKWRPTWVSTWVFVVIEILLSSFTVIAGDTAGSVGFAGGYPLVGVFTAIYAKGTTGGIVAGSALFVTQLSLLGAVRSDIASRVSFLISYLFTAAAGIGIAAVLRASDRRRTEAEERMAAAENERARAEAKTEMTVHLHDSVLQTLALIQRDADTSDQSKRLARTQERELRAWLYQGHDGTQPSGFTDGLTTMTASVEDLTGVRIETVTVSDRTLDDRLRALLAAAREATMNAAKHAGVADISVFGEVSEHGVSVYVKDRGVGFDTNTASAGRGIPDSILARMERHDGVVSIRSELGKGTEVILTMANQQ